MRIAIASLGRLAVTMTVAAAATANAPAWAQAFEVIKAFENAAGPYAPLVQGPDGAFYGTTVQGGVFDGGVVFRVAFDGTSWRRSIIHNFDGDHGSRPWSGLTIGPDGALYGTTTGGGFVGGGTVYRLLGSGSSWTFSPVHDFAAQSATDGTSPLASLTLGADGALYGTTAAGGSNGLGCVFRLNPSGASWTYEFMYSFDGTNGAEPWGRVLLGPDGALYGTTYHGGASNLGTIYRLANTGAAWAPSFVHSFGGTDGANPWAGLTLGSDGAFYGTTENGGSPGPAGTPTGTIFRLSGSGSSWAHAIIVDFDLTNGAFPSGELITIGDALYGTTRTTSPGYGSVFRLSGSGSSWTHEVLHSFGLDAANSNEEGLYPVAGVIQGADGALYGTTNQGGKGVAGTAFRLAGDSYETIASFGGAEGYASLTGLVAGADGALFGTTAFGGDRYGGGGWGLNFRLSRTAGQWAYEVVHDFGPGGFEAGGLLSPSGLSVGADGSLYGTQLGGFSGGLPTCGTIFRLGNSASTWTRDVLHSFDCSPYPENPLGGVTVGSDGALYGTTQSDGTSALGTVYRLVPSGGTWTFETLYEFVGGAEGASPYSTVVFGSDGALYGTTVDGGSHSVGVAFRLSPNVGGGWTYQVIHDFDGTSGGSPYGRLASGADGALYGTTYNGGPGGNQGTVYRLTWNGTDWTHEVLAAFGDDASAGAGPYGGLAIGPDGTLYGSTTSGGGPANSGTIFRIAWNGVAWVRDVLHTCSRLDCANPRGDLYFLGHSVYGTAQSGGPEGGGVVFRIVLPVPPSAQVAPSALAFGTLTLGQTSASQAVTVTNVGGGTLNVTANVTGDFAITNGCTSGLGDEQSCTIGVAFAPTATGLRTGTLTVTTDAGGPFVVSLSGTGTTVSLSPAALAFGPVELGFISAPQTVTLQNTGPGPLTIAGVVTLGDFTRTTTCPLAPATLPAGTSCTIAVSFAPAAEGPRTGALTVTDDAAGSPRTVSLTGVGTTTTPADWEYTIIKAFAGDPSNPRAQLLQGADGALYGVTYEGGSSGAGTVFKVNPDGSGFTIVVEFAFASMGVGPQTRDPGLVQGSDGVLYGTASQGGVSGDGTVFKVNPDGSGFTKLVDLDNVTKGSFPEAGLVQGTDGALYGTTRLGGVSDDGTVFKVNPDGSGFTKLVDFGGAKGANPSGLVQGTDGALYGTTINPSHGTVFRVNPDGSGFTTLVNFDGLRGSSPLAGLVQGTDGALYGTTPQGGQSGEGTVFKVNPDGTGFTNLVNFDNGTTRGGNPSTALMQGTDGALYGTTKYGGASGGGTVFKVNPDGSALGKLVDFDGATKGAYLAAGLMQGTDGALYGTASFGGPGGGGVVFRLRRRGLVAAEVLPSSLTFGSLNIGRASASQVVTVTNSGGGTVDVTNVAVTGDFQATNGCTGGLATGASCMIQVVFVPAATGPLPGNLTVTTTAGGPFTVSLSGTGTAPATTLSPASLDFGSLVVGTTSVAQTLTLQNAGTGPLMIASIAALGDFTRTTTCPLAPATLAAGASCSVSVTFTPSATGTRTGTLSVSNDAAGSPYTVSLSGQGTQPPAAAVTPSALAFGSVVVGQASAPQTVTVTNTGGGTLNVTGVSATGDFQVTNACTTGVSGGASCGIAVRFAPTATGARSGVLTVTTNAGTQAVSLSGTGTSPIASLTPAALAFGSMAVGVTSAVKTATLANTGDGPLTIASIVTTGDYTFANGCPVAPATLPPGGTCTIDVTFTPTATGSRPGTLRVTDNAAGSPRTVGLTGTGAVLSVSPTSLAFGSVPLQTTSAGKMVTVFNSTLGPLAISSIAVTTLPSDYAQTNTCPSTLAAGASCVVTVTFTPTAVGSRPGQLRISYGASAVNVALSGTGTFNLGVAPGSLTFAKQALGTTSAAKTVTLTNATGAPIAMSSITSAGEFPIQSNSCGPSLAGGSTCSFTVAFTPSAAGTRTGQVTIADNATGNPHKVNLTGTGTIPLTVAPTSLGFGSVIAGVTSTAKTVTLTNPNPVPITFVSIVASGDYALMNGCGPTLDPSTSCSLTVTFRPTATGARPATLDILSDATTSPQKVNLNGSGTLPLNTSGNLAFGNVIAGVTSAAKTITLSNPSPLVAITIASVVPAGDFAATDNCAGSIAPAGSCTVNVTFTPTTSGARSGSVTVASNATNSPRTSTLGGTGTLPITASPTSVAFGNQPVNTTSPARTLTLTNASPLLPIPITSIVTSGDFAQTNDCGTSIAAGGGCTVTLTFTPTATGSRTGKLTVTSGATSSPNQVNLSGRGI